MQSKVLQSSLIISIGIMLGRASGLIREYVIAYNLGASMDADIAVVLLTLPDFFISLFAGNAVSTILIPKINESETSSHKALFLKTSFIFICIFSFIAILLSFFSPYVWKAFAPGLSLSNSESTHSLLRICSISIPIIALCSISRAFLQSIKKFTFIGLENFVYNLAFVLCFILFYSNMGLMAVSTGIIIAALIKYIPQLFIAIKNITGRFLVSDIFFSIDKQMIKSYIQVLVSYNILIMLPYIARAASSYRGEGALAIFNYAFKISELPKTLLISAITMVVFPYLSSALKRKNTDGKKIIQKSLFLSLAFSLLIVLTAIPILFYFYYNPFSIGKLTEGSIATICVSVGIAILGMPAEAFNYNIIMLMHAHKNTRTPTYINIIAAIATVPIIWILGKNIPYGAFIGLTISQWILFPVYFLQLRIHNKTAKDNRMG